MTGKQPIAEDRLRDAAVDVAFEFKMFRHAWSRLDVLSQSLGNNNSGADLPLIPTPWSTAKNSSPSVQVVVHPSDFLGIEGVLIHFRNLIEFFFTNKEVKGDLVLAHHYTGEKPRAGPPWARAYGQRCNELLAHLTYRRSTHYRRIDRHHWPDILVQCGRMDNEINEFLGSLTPERRSWFK